MNLKSLLFDLVSLFKALTKKKAFYFYCYRKYKQIKTGYFGARVDDKVLGDVFI